MPKKLILALDQGTTNSKALLVDGQGRVVARASRRVSIRYPNPGWVEQDAAELYATLVDAARECLEVASGDEIVAVAVTNQRETSVVWDRTTGEPLGPAVVWQCRRSAPICDQLKRDGKEKTVWERTGLSIDPMFSATKIRWLLDHIPGARVMAGKGELCAGTVDSWVLWNLTAGKSFCCDLTNASRTLLLNARTADWDQDLLELFGIPREVLPQLRYSSGIFGTTADKSGFPAGIPIGALIGDSHAALFGHAVFRPGLVKATYGTGSSLMTLTAGPVFSSRGLSTTIGWSAGGQVHYALEGNILSTGATLDWTADLLRLANGVSELLELASQCRDSGGVYLVPAFAGLGAPHWDAGARGLVCGLTRGSSASHLARAALESVAYQVRDVFEAIGADLGQRPSELLADGGASRSNELMQLQADLLGVPVRRNLSTDLAAIGAAWLAGLASGLWTSLEELENLPRDVDTFQPQMAEADRERLYRGWLEAVARARSSEKRICSDLSENG